MMTGISGTSKTDAIHNYYTCNGRKKKLCNKQNAQKDYIEDLVVTLARTQLTDENIIKISSTVADLYEKEKDSSNIKRLTKLLKENEKQKANLLEALKLGNASATAINSVFAEIDRLDKSQTEIEKEIATESINYMELSADEIRFFLAELRNGDINDIKYRRLLITVLVNAVYLYDDRYTVIFNSSDNPVEITKSLLDDIEASDSSFIESKASPK